MEVAPDAEAAIRIERRTVADGFHCQVARSKLAAPIGVRPGEVEPEGERSRVEALHSVDAIPPGAQVFGEGQRAVARPGLSDAGEGAGGANRDPLQAAVKVSVPGRGRDDGERVRYLGGGAQVVRLLDGNLFIRRQGHRHVPEVLPTVIVRDGCGAEHRPYLMACDRVECRDVESRPRDTGFDRGQRQQVVLLRQDEVIVAGRDFVVNDCVDVGIGGAGRDSGFGEGEQVKHAIGSPVCVVVERKGDSLPPCRRGRCAAPQRGSDYWRFAASISMSMAFAARAFAFSRPPFGMAATVLLMFS